MEQAKAILDELHCPFVINQNRYNMLDRTIEQNGLKDAVAKNKVGLICFSPLAQGLLSDRYLKGIPEDSRIHTDGRFLKAETVEEKTGQLLKLNEIAKNRGETLSQMALKWILKDGIVTSVLIGASRPEQIITNLGVLFSPEFTEDELRQIDAIVEAKC